MDAYGPSFSIGLDNQEEGPGQEEAPANTESAQEGDSASDSDDAPCGTDSDEASPTSKAQVEVGRYTIQARMQSTGVVRLLGDSGRIVGYPAPPPI